MVDGVVNGFLNVCFTGGFVDSRYWPVSEFMDGLVGTDYYCGSRLM